MLIAAALLLLSARTYAQDPPAPPEVRPSFQEWLAEVRREALDRGIRQEIVDQTLADLEEPLPVVIERDRSQAETVLTLDAYISRRLTPAMVRRGREMAQRHDGTLERVARSYGVPARIIAAIWGAESNFGGFSGSRPTIAALATLAWDPRRSTLFRRELFDALEILNRGDIEPSRMKGSWAGAMGQPQFMPSSYLAFAVDEDKDGRRDIWNTPGDVFASIANYLKGKGWTAGQTWGREVKVSKPLATRIAAQVPRRAGSCGAKRDMTVQLPMDDWRRMGVERLGGGALPTTEMKASMVAGVNRYFLVYDNYDALLDYNCAHAYALTVGLLGDRLNATSPPATPRPSPAAGARSTSPSRR